MYWLWDRLNVSCGLVIYMLSKWKLSCWAVSLTLKSGYKKKKVIDVCKRKLIACDIRTVREAPVVINKDV